MFKFFQSSQEFVYQFATNFSFKTLLKRKIRNHFVDDLPAAVL